MTIKEMLEQYESIKAEIQDLKDVYKRQFTYCPNCGAKMTEG